MCLKVFITIFNQNYLFHKIIIYSISSPIHGWHPWMANVSLSEIPLLYKRLKARISNLVGSRKGGEPIVLTNSPPGSEPVSPVGTPSLTEQRGPMRSSPVERSRDLPELTPVAVSPISHTLGLSWICLDESERDCLDGSERDCLDESDSD